VVSFLAEQMFQQLELFAVVNIAVQVSRDD